MRPEPIRRRLLAVALAATLWACGETGTERPEAPPAIPRGYAARIEIQQGGRLYGFGPFVGYYFRPAEPPDTDELRFLVFNERGFYTEEMPVNARLFEGTAVLMELPQVGDLPAGAERITPVFFADAPEGWKRTRPQPKEEYRHFHSCYDARGAVRLGYWLRHVASAEFTYDMGGRVDARSPLHHRVRPGVDRGFPEIIEFDRGPSPDE